MPIIHIATSTHWSGGLRVRFETIPVVPHRRPNEPDVWNIRYDSAAQIVIIPIHIKQQVKPENIRRAGALLIRWLAHTQIPSAAVALEENDLTTPEAVFALLEGMILGDYRFDAYLSDAQSSPVEVTLLTDNPAAYQDLLQRAIITCEATNLARTLTHEPANVINPVSLAERVQALAEEYGLKCTVLDDKQLQEMGAGAMVAVGQGSKTPSRLIVLEYAGKEEAKPIALVGKSLTFDTGGYSLKGSENMLGMHGDKAGAMAVLAILIAAARLGLKTPLVGVLAAAENMVSAYSYRPNDIIRTLSGKTVEVLNTDAEGRLVLADALTYTQQKFAPRALIDLATLTGGVVVALGSIRAGMFATDDDLAQALYQSGERTHERLWRLPLDPEYTELVTGDDADLKNSAMPGRKAAPIVGAIFLKQFVNEGQAWAHLDIAGTAWTETREPYCPKGATGFGVRLLLDYLNTLEGK